MITYRISTVRVDTKTETASVGGGSNKQPQQQAATAAPDAAAPQQFSKDSALGSGGVRPDRKAVGGALVPLPAGEPPGISGPDSPGAVGGLGKQAGVEVALAPKGKDPPDSANSSGSATKGAAGLVRPKTSRPYELRCNAAVGLCMFRRLASSTSGLQRLAAQLMLPAASDVCPPAH